MYELKQRQIELDGLLHAHTLADEDFTITLNCLMDIASRAYELFESSKVEQKRHLINFVLTNLQLKGKKLMFTVKKPFDLFLNLDDGYEWRGLEDELRTDYYLSVVSFHSQIESLNKEFNFAT